MRNLSNHSLSAPVKVLLIIYFLLQIQYVHAQIKISNAAISSDFIPSSRYIRPEDSAKTQSTIVQLRHSASLAVIISSNIDSSTGKVRLWTGNLAANYTTLSGKDFEKQIFPSRLFAGEFGVQHYRSLQNNWGFQFIASTGIYSDLTDISVHDIFFGAGAIFLKHYKPHFTLGFGLFVHNTFGTPIVWPAVTVQWQPGGRYKLSVNVPDKGPGLAYNISLTRKSRGRSEAAIFFRPRQMAFDVKRQADTKRLASYWELPIGVSNRWQLGKASVFISGGIVPVRSMQFSEKKLSKMFASNPAHKLAANCFVGTGIRLDF